MLKPMAGLGATDSATVRRIALHALTESRKNFASWESACDDYRKQGYRPHYCRHGRNMWTDNDIPCGTCEESGYYGWNYLEELGEALAYARGLMSETVKRRSLIIPLITEFPNDTPPLSPELWAWVSAPIIDWIK